MTKEERQAELDREKWMLSVEKGRDCCGEFDYCNKCDKNDEFPCAEAYDRAVKKPATPKKSTAAKPAAKKTAAKKPTAAKTTAKK